MPLGMLGKYERLDVLGHGASGIVYLAKDTLLGRLVALKEVAAADAGERERVLSEARVLDRLRHPNIVQIYGVDDWDDKVVIAMEYVRGRSLLDVLRRTPQLAVPDAVNIAAQICDGLAFAHAQRTVHRDVKPANVLVCDDGTVKLVDFGLAEVLGTHSLAGGAGTYAYMAPEDFGGQGGGRASDIWAAGVVLWEMLAGRRPFRADNPKDPFAWKTVVDGQPAPPVSRYRPDVPPELDAVLRRALSHDPAGRYADAGAMAEALRQAPPAPNNGGARISLTPKTGGEGSRPVPPLLGVRGPLDDPPTVAQSVSPVLLPGFLNAADIDAFLVQAPDHWERAKENLADGTLAAWLLHIGEGPLAEVAASLFGETERPADDCLRDFLYRAGLDTVGEAKRAHTEGQRLLRAGHSADAVPLLERAVRLDPAPAVYHHSLAEALRVQEGSLPSEAVRDDATLPRPEGAVRSSGTLALSTDAVDFGALRAGQTRSARVTLRNAQKGVVQGRVVSAPGWVRVEPAAFATRHRQPLTLTANADGVWPAGGAKLSEPIACRDVLVIETDGGARQEVSLSATVLPARRGLPQIGVWYLPLLLCCVLPALAGLVAPRMAGHAVRVRHLWEPGLLAGGLLSASLFALAWAADTVLPLRLVPLALLAVLGGGFFGSVGNVEFTHALKAALVQTSVPVLVMLVLQTVLLAADPRGWGRWQLWRWIAGATGLLASWVLWHSG